MGQRRLRRRAVELDRHLPEATDLVVAATLEQGGRGGVQCQGSSVQARRALLGEPRLGQVDDGRAQPTTLCSRDDHAEEAADGAVQLGGPGGHQPLLLLEEPRVVLEIGALPPAEDVVRAQAGGMARERLLVGGDERGDRRRVRARGRANRHPGWSVHPGEASGRDVVEEARGDVHVPGTVGVRSLEEDLPVPVRGLVRADLGGDDRELERHADLRQGRIDEVSIGVGEDRELPAAGAGVLERLAHLRERLPRGQRTRERTVLVRGERQVFSLGEPGQGHGEDVAVAAPGLLVLDLRLELVVGVQEPPRLRRPEQALELAADAGVPVDQSPIAVERRPALHGG